MQYAELCSEFPGMTNCPELDESIHKVENELNMFLGLPEITVHLLGKSATWDKPWLTRGTS